MRQVKPYTYFSEIYPHLMSSIDYKFWAEYICDIHSTLGKKNDIALEIAAGNCKLAENIDNQFKELYLTDLSPQMLMNNKSKYQGICCDMMFLPFKISFDFIFSTFDSINYLNNEESLNLFFTGLKNYLKKNGLFLFDVSLKHNSRKYQKKLNRKGKYQDIDYIQKSDFDEKKKMHINIIDIKTETGLIYREIHKQKIYDFYYYFEVLDLAGFYVLECFDAFTFKEGNPNSDRVQFVVKRKI